MSQKGLPTLFTHGVQDPTVDHDLIRTVGDKRS